MTRHCAIAILLSALVLALGLEPDPSTGSYEVTSLSWRVAALITFLGYLLSAVTICAKRHHIV
ncbi:MAG: hypothetical protein PVI15_03170 [Chromatiales bacterium]|jgi:hypothetical protein